MTDRLLPSEKPATPAPGASSGEPEVPDTIATHPCQCDGPTKGTHTHVKYPCPTCGTEKWAWVNRQTARCSECSLSPSLQGAGAPQQKCWNTQVAFTAISRQQVIAPSEAEAEQIAIDSVKNRSFIDVVTVTVSGAWLADNRSWPDDR